MIPGKLWLGRNDGQRWCGQTDGQTDRQNPHGKSGGGQRRNLEVGVMTGGLEESVPFAV